MIDCLNQLDTDLFLARNGHNTPFLDRFMVMVTGKYIWAPLYAVFLFTMFRRFRQVRMALVFTLLAILSVALADQTCATLIRPLVHRQRPSNLENPLSALAVIVGGYRGGAYGFPSCHAANSMALAVFMALTVRRKGFSFLVFTWAAVNAYSRLYLGVHYPGDLLVGALIGSALGYACFKAANAISRTRACDTRAELFQMPLSTSSGNITVTPTAATAGAASALLLSMIFISLM